LKEQREEIIIEEHNESSSGSDSGQSEDNLDVDELMKLLPTKLSKKRKTKKASKQP